MAPPKIPVNPDYDWNKEPSEQPAYFNPVTACNREIFYANEIIGVTAGLADLNRELGLLKLSQMELKLKKQEMEDTILVTEDFSKDQTRNIPTQQAHVRARLMDTDMAEEYGETVANLRQVEAHIADLQVKVDNGRAAIEALKLASQNIQTALSFYKAELKTAYR